MENTNKFSTPVNPNNSKELKEFLGLSDVELLESYINSLKIAYNSVSASYPYLQIYDDICKLYAKFDLGDKVITKGDFLVVYSFWCASRYLPASFDYGNAPVLRTIASRIVEAEAELQKIISSQIKK